MLIDVQKISALGAKQQVFLLLPDFTDSDDADVEHGVAELKEHFEPTFLQSNYLVERTAKGRGTVYFFRLGDVLSVLRHYYRGGMIAKLIKDRFVFAGIENTRAYRELKILTYLSNAGVSVPKPVAARILLLGMTYKADIITEAVDDGAELHSLLRQNEVEEDVWAAIGEEVAKMHHKNACHDDLNVKNILVRYNFRYDVRSNVNKSQGRIVLLDFDACSIKHGDSWKRKNIARFKRSLDKQQKRETNYHFTPAQWDVFLAAYKQATLALEA